MRIRTRAAMAALPLAAAMALTGCGGSEGGDGVASANNGQQGSSRSSPSLNPDEMAQKFARCLRENGIDVDDPKPGKGVGLNIKPGTSKATVDQAMEACSAYDPAAREGADKGVPKEVQEKLRKYSQCMREKGVEDYPDPVPGGGLRLDGAIEEDPDFTRAHQGCEDLMPTGKGERSNEEAGKG